MLNARRYIIAIIASLLVFCVSSCCLFGRREPPGEKVRMEVTGYCDCGQCCGYYRSCWTLWLIPYVSAGPNRGRRKKIGITSDGRKAKVGTIAADIRKYPYGTRMYIPGYGWGEVHDIGSAIKGDHIDLFFNSHKEALKWGVKYLDITVIRK